MISLYNVKRELVKLIQTKSGNKTTEIIERQSGELVYNNYLDRTVN